MKDNAMLIDYILHDRDEGCFVWIFNIGAESVWHPNSFEVKNISEIPVINSIEEINLLITRPQDIIILHTEPSKDFIDALALMGIVVPTTLIPKNPDKSKPIIELILEDELLIEKLRRMKEYGACLVPYAITELEEELSEKTGLHIFGTSAHIARRFNDKSFARQIAEELGFDTVSGKLCAEESEIAEEYNRLNLEGYERVVIKYPHNASGKGIYIVRNSHELETTLMIVRRYIRKGAKYKWIVEGWCDTRLDINYQICISKTGEVKNFSIKEQAIKDAVYYGSRIPPRISNGEYDQYNRFASQIGAYMFQQGYYGIASIDSIMKTDNTIIPIIEINARFTLSTYLMLVEKMLSGNSIAVSTYRNLLSKIPIIYGHISELFEEMGALYNSDRMEGVFLYSSASLPTDKSADGLYRGRMFALIVAKTEVEVERYLGVLEKVVSKINC